MWVATIKRGPEPGVTDANPMLVACSPRICCHRDGRANLPPTRVAILGVARNTSVPTGEPSVAAGIVSSLIVILRART